MVALQMWDSYSLLPSPYLRSSRCYFHLYAVTEQPLYLGTAFEAAEGREGHRGERGTMLCVDLCGPQWGSRVLAEHGELGRRGTRRLGLVLLILGPEELGWEKQ